MEAIKNWLSWHDPHWTTPLNRETILDYFCRSINPFYENGCNNDIIRLHGLPLVKLLEMQGTEYIVMHVAEPALFVIRKQNRISPEQATPLVNFYVINRMCYQAPMLTDVISSRWLNVITKLQVAFAEAGNITHEQEAQYGGLPIVNMIGKYPFPMPPTPGVPHGRRSFPSAGGQPMIITGERDGNSSPDSGIDIELESQLANRRGMLPNSQDDDQGEPPKKKARTTY